jgi:hypothetical protein
MMLDPKMVYRRPCMEILENDQTRISDNGDHIVFERDRKRAIFHIPSCRLEYWDDADLMVTYNCSRMFLIFALRRTLCENFFS